MAIKPEWLLASISARRATLNEFFWRPENIVSFASQPRLQKCKHQRQHAIKFVCCTTRASCHLALCVCVCCPLFLVCKRARHPSKTILRPLVAQLENAASPSARESIE
jgi:hypothetical protein